MRVSREVNLAAAPGPPAGRRQIKDEGGRADPFVAAPDSPGASTAGSSGTTRRSLPGSADARLRVVDRIHHTQHTAVAISRVSRNPPCHVR